MGRGQSFLGWVGGGTERKICPSLSLRDELTAQLLFQLHGLFENNVMSFITDNSGKWLLWQPGKRMGLISQSEVPAMPPVCTNSLSSMGAPPILCFGEEAWEEEGKRSRWKDYSLKRKRTNEETEAPGEGLQQLAVSPKFLKGKDHGWSTVPSLCPAQTRHSAQERG